MRKSTLIILLVVLIIIVVSGIFVSEHYTAQPEFCGSCHIMKKYYKSWSKSKHGEKNVACVACHYAPGEKGSIKAKFRGLGQLFTYLSVGGNEVRAETRVSDRSCTTSECHPAEKFQSKKIEYTKKIKFIHDPHEHKKIEGQTLHCNTCHIHVSADKHFEVPVNLCSLCHFKNSKFNEGRGKCVHCHDIPTKSLQKQKKAEKPDEKSVTHKSLEKAKVPCQSCHYELIQGEGEVKSERCLSCHDEPDTLKKATDKKLMHQEHVAGQNAKCFDCHSSITHKQIEFLDPVRETCFICHPDHHKYQKLLLLGDKVEDVATVPGLMYDVKTNCIGCHREERLIKGEKVLHGSAKACAACHTEKHEGMVKEWKDKAKQELKDAKEIEKEALDAIKKAKGKVPAEKLEKAMAMLKEGQDNMHIVEYGGGVHNKKYSVVLLDNAMDNFEDLIDLLSSPR